MKLITFECTVAKQNFNDLIRVVIYQNEWRPLRYAKLVMKPSTSKSIEDILYFVRL